MTVFGAYSRYYNLLYEGKDYAAEAEYVHGLIQRHHPGARTILNLGCGTGTHDFELAKFGYEITGIDISEEMLAAANLRLSTLTTQISPLSFLQGDIRSARLGKTFDVVISLFHVMSYQTSNDDLRAAFDTARAHLDPGGIFLFDSWYGPAVLKDPPVVRVKRLEDDKIEVVRIAEPVMHYNENVVDVNYSVMIIDKSSGKVEKLNEMHRMRYLFFPEILGQMADKGYSLIDAHEWFTGNSLGDSSWYLTVVGRANG
jgi:SAM-dependent methyltransferase